MCDGNPGYNERGAHRPFTPPPGSSPQLRNPLGHCANTREACIIRPAPDTPPLLSVIACVN